MRVALTVLKALSDETRLRMLLALRQKRELCVCQLVALLELAPSTVSKHLSVLHAARLLERRKEGRWIHYRFDTNGMAEPLRQATGLLLDMADTGARATDDHRRLTEVCAEDLDALCERLFGKQKEGA